MQPNSLRTAIALSLVTLATESVFSHPFLSFLRKSVFHTALLAIVLVAMPAVPAQADTITVNCSTSPAGALSAALATLSLQGPHTITVIGTCVENVDIQSRERLTLQGPAGNMATIVNAANPAFWVLNVGRSRQVMFRRLIVQGGSIGIRTDSASSVDIGDCIVENNPGQGISIDENSTIRINRTTIRNNGAAGLNVTTNSSVSLSLGGPDPQFIHIHHNAGPGIGLTAAAMMQINGGLTVEDNQGAGINATGSTLMVNGSRGPNVIRSNNRIGIIASVSSSLVVTGQTVIENHGWFGILVLQSAARISGAVIRQNGAAPPPVQAGVFALGAGLAVSTNATAQVSAAQITNNGGYGVVLRINSSARIANTTISGNARDGVFAELASGTLFIEANAISGNGGASARCTTDSWAAGAFQGSVPPINCPRR